MPTLNIQPDLPDDEALDQAQNLLNLIEIVYKPIPKLRELKNKISQVRKRSEKYCPDSPEVLALVSELEALTSNDEVMDCLLIKIKNSTAIFDIASKIGKDPLANQSIILQMSAEIDAARWLCKGAISGKYDSIEYLAPSGKHKRPDFLMMRGNRRYAAEVKLLEPAEGVDGDKVIGKMLNKAREGFEQIRQYHEREGKIKEGYVLAWTRRQIPKALISYNDHVDFVGNKLAELALPFKATVYLTGYGQGIADYEPVASGGK